MTTMISRIGALFLVGGLVASPGCDRVVDVKGTVRDRAGASLEGVVVTLKTSGRVPFTAKTARDGSFDVGFIGADPADIRISFQKAGYKTLERPIGKEDRSTMDVTLMPDS